MTATPALPAPVATWCARAAPGEAVQPLRGSHGQTRAWRVGQGPHARVVRLARSPRTAAQECAALARLERPDAVAVHGRVPRLLCNEGDVLVVSWIEGQVARSDREAAEHVVPLVRALHALPCDDGDELSLRDAVSARCHALASRLEAVDADAAAWIEALRVRGVDAFDGVRRVWCHGDLRLDNVVMPVTGAALIDFEHARPDAAAFDAATLELDIGGGAPTEALTDLWGDLAPEGRMLARVMVAASTLAWGRAHGDAAFAERGARQLRVLRSYRR